MRLTEIRMLDGPNVYRLEPAVKIEISVGRRRTWYGTRSPGRHAAVRLGRPVPPRVTAASAREVAAWVRRLHRLTGAAAWLASEGRAPAGSRARIPVTIHRTTEPGQWIIAFPWRERERAEALAEAAVRLVDLGLDARTTRPAGPRVEGGSRTLARAIARIGAAATTPPEWVRDGDRRVPIVSISGTNGKSTTTRMIGHVLRASGKHVGMTTSDGVVVDGALVEEGDMTGPMGAQSVLRHAAVDVAVLETARGGIVLRGVGYESNDAAVLTNVSADHLDLHGLHTLPELAEVKSVIARITRVDGAVVLNADDALVASVARTVRAPVWLFSLRPRGPRLRRHLARGGRAYVLDDGWLVELEGTRRRPIIRATDVPATILGLARHNVANALAAAAAARALGASVEDVGAGLRSFRSTAEQAPGRLNLYRVDGRIVIVDFAHNEAGMSVVLDVAEGLVGPRGRRTRTVTAIVGTAGDRPDDTLQGIGRIAAERADRLAIKETLRYLRGRTRESVVGEIRAGMASGGAHTADIPVYEDEPSAIRAELTTPGRAADDPRGSVVILMCHSDRDGVARVLAELGGQPVHDAQELTALTP